MTIPGEGSRIEASSALEIVLELDSTIFRLSAIKKAAYKFGGRFHCTLSTADDKRVRVILTAKAPMDNPDYWSGEFRNEVLDQELREVVAQETEPIRNLLLAQAFSATSLLDSAGEEGEYRIDPLNICRSQSNSSNHQPIEVATEE